MTYPHTTNQQGNTDSRVTEAKRVVSTILEQIPELLKVKSVQQRDGSMVPFAAERIGASLSDAMSGAGVRDNVLLARCTHQVLMRIQREFDGHTTPTTDDVVRVITMVLVDNNLPYAVKKYLTARAERHVSEQESFVGGGVRMRRKYTVTGRHPYDEIEWETRDAVINDAAGNPVFEQKGVEVPKSWSQTATNIVVSKYFRGEIGKPEREVSIRQMIDRVVQTITGWGRKDGYFATEEDATVFQDELTSILVNQRAAFNSPVWFNVGINPRPQCSACFINSVQDDMRSILNLSVTEGMLFKYGSGTGTNLSTLRSSKELLANS
ncbi:ATP cone domain-containing protein, partial [Patescibacteria group bacterium]